MIHVQKLYILILKPISKAIARVRYQSREMTIYLSTCAIMVLFMVWRFLSGQEIYVDQNIKALLWVVFFVLLLIMSIKGALKVQPWNKISLFFLLLCPIFMLLASFDHFIGDGFRADAIIILIALPGLYLVWGNRGDYEHLYKLVANAMVLVLVLYFLLSFFLVPIGTGEFGGRYAGLTSNPNIFGMFCTAGVTCALYMITEGARSQIILSLLLLAESLLGAIASVSRTCLLIIVLQFAVFLFFYIRHKIIGQRDKLKNSLILCCTLLISFSMILFWSYYENMGQTAIKTIGVVMAAEPTSTAEQAQTPPVDRLQIKNKDLYSLSSGRTTVWKVYLENLNLKGHDGEELLYIGDEYGKTEWAHNTALEIAYRCGIIPGVLFFLLEIYAGIYALSCLFSKKHEPWKLFSILSILSFCIYSVLEVVLFPYEHISVFLFFMAIMPMMRKKKQKCKRS